MWRSMSQVGVPAFSVSMLLLGMFIEVMAQSIQGTGVERGRVVREGGDAAVGVRRSSAAPRLRR